MGSNSLCLGLPVKDRRRALDFYSAVLGRDLRERGAVPPRFERSFAGTGVVLRLQIEQCLDEALEVVWSRAAKFSSRKRCDLDTPYALVLDTEGNRVALYTQASDC